MNSSGLRLAHQPPGQDGVGILRPGASRGDQGLRGSWGVCTPRELLAQALQLQLSPCRVHGAYEDLQGHSDPLGTG